MIRGSLSELVDPALRTALRYVAAVNQGPAKLLLDPIYEAVAAALLRGRPVPEALSTQHFPENLFFDYREQSRRLQWSIDDWDFAQARPELCTPRQRALVHSFATGETSGFAVGGGF